jgi:hypothetical protein
VTNVVVELSVEPDPFEVEVVGQMSLEVGEESFSSGRRGRRAFVGKFKGTFVICEHAHLGVSSNNSKTFLSSCFGSFASAGSSV